MGFEKVNLRVWKASMPTLPQELQSVLGVGSQTSALGGSVLGRKLALSRLISSSGSGEFHEATGCQKVLSWERSNTTCSHLFSAGVELVSDATAADVSPAHLLKETHCTTTGAEKPAPKYASPPAQVLHAETHSWYTMFAKPSRRSRAAELVRSCN